MGFFAEMTVGELATLLAASAALLAAIGNTVLAYRTRGEVHQVRLSTNSRLDELLALTRQVSHAEGFLEGREEERADPKGGA